MIEQAKTIFRAGVEAVDPQQLIDQYCTLKDGEFTIRDTSFDLSSIEDVWVVGFGKASARMAYALEKLLGNYVSGGVVITKYGHQLPCKTVKIREAAHPVPDERGVEATKELMHLLEQTSSRDLVITLISGGGSALLVDVPSEATLKDLMLANDLLTKSAASIHEINTVRKHLSTLKGGQLGRAIYPAQGLSLILSDVLGDELSVIASGPTVADDSTFSQAVAILQEYHLWEKFPNSLKELLREGVEGRRQETPKKEALSLQQMQNVLLGSNRMALEACQAKAEELGFQVKILTYEFSGETHESMEQLWQQLQREMGSLRKEARKQPICFLLGGETTLNVRGDGLGGRNQHRALLAAELIQGDHSWTILSAGTDGTDGPTDAAGAVVNGTTVQVLQKEGKELSQYKEAFDSYTYFKDSAFHMITGPTYTNVMDLIVAVNNGQ
ncbi:glycerate kinase type-2 family protein [Algivirga pacifica]|uniref:Glycerate kinase n=1 Tax=Algivirga pacifica TaxID=1162670 RepID=A0ABP9D4E2_9BACT